jgi:hypothetical protein
LKLFVDDCRDPPDNSWLLARNSYEAIKMCEAIWPTELALDHDLGGDDNIMDFLKALYVIAGDRPVPKWSAHSANPCGRQNIEAFMNSWEKICGDPRSDEKLTSAAVSQTFNEGCYVG